MAQGPPARYDSLGFNALTHADSLGRSDAAFSLPFLSDTPRGFGLTRQLSFDPLRTMDMLEAQAAQPPLPGAPANQHDTRPSRRHAAEEPSHGARALHGVRTHAQFKKPERSGAVKVRAPPVPTPVLQLLRFRGACGCARHQRRPPSAARQQVGSSLAGAGGASPRRDTAPQRALSARGCPRAARRPPRGIGPAARRRARISRHARAFPPRRPARSAHGEHPRRLRAQVSNAEVPLSEMKHADHRRLLSRWGKALFRFAGIKRDDFARRTGSYRENFLHVLTVCFGTTFEGPGAWWYDHSHAGAFAAALLYCATSGRVRVDESETANMFTKKEPERAASSWTVNEAQLLAWGVAPGELAALFRGEARTDEAGFPRGTPLIVPAPHELPPPAPGAAHAAAAATAAGAAVLAASGAFRLPVPPPPPLGSNAGSGAYFLPSPAPSRGGSDVAALLQQVPSMPLPFSSTPLARQNTVATLAILMCQSEYLERAAGRPLDRTFSDGARALMATLAAQGALPDQEPALQLGSAAPAWARHAAA